MNDNVNITQVQQKTEDFQFSGSSTTRWQLCVELQAPRTDPLLQRTYWTGYKKFHGLKWQTVVMANGMDFEIWGPVSVRHPDSFTLNKSRIEYKLEECQRGQLRQFKMYGDSAYYDSE
jgi:hypothetical protein